MTTDEVWHLGANDNTRGGWLVFLLYLIVAALCWREVARYRATLAERAPARHFWIGLSLFVTVLAANKQLDLQTLLIELGRDAASAEGIVEYSRWINAAFVAVMGAIGICVVAYLWKVFRRASGSGSLVIVGTAALIGFVLFRTASINHLELLEDTVETHRLLIAVEILILGFLGFAVVRYSGRTKGRIKSRRFQ